MADDSPKSVVNGFLRHLPPWPRKALNNSVIGMEQAYRQRKGLPLLTDADIEALKADQPMLWESGDASSAPASAGSPPTPASTATAAAPASPAPAAATSAPSAGISEEVAKWVAAGNKGSKSTIAAEQARRGRKGLPALKGAEITALLGEPATPAAAAPTAPAAATAASAPRPAAAAATVTASSAASVARSGEPTRYVGTPAVGTFKAVAGAGLASAGPEDNEINQQRRRLWSSVAAFLAAWVPCVLPLLSATHLIRACDQLQNRLSRGIRSGSGHQVATEISHLGGPHTRSLVRDLRALHASGLHARLETQREQI
jgi:hypothetical protein